MSEHEDHSLVAIQVCEMRVIAVRAPVASAE